MTDLHAEGRRAELELTSLRVQRDIVEARIDALTKYTQSLQRAIKKQIPKEAT
jgi:3-dehydroquinate dehydratase